MPPRVHALIVVRPDGRAPAAFHLKRTLRAVDAQTRRPDAVTVVLCGSDDALVTAAASGSASIVTAPPGTTFAAALDIARRAGDGPADHDGGDDVRDGAAVWLLAQDTAPEPETLARLLGVLELAPSVIIAAPKLVRWDDRTEIASLGISMTRYGRAVGLSDGELDQGQRDADEDVLGADVRGMLVRSGAWQRLRGLDRGLAGADEGLDLSVRARLLGTRVSLVPSAIVAVAGDGAAGLPIPSDGTRRRHNVYARRRAQLQRRLAYAPVVAVPVHWLSLLPLALWRTILALVAKTPARVLPEWGAAFVALVRVDQIARARAGIRRTREIPWTRIAPLRVSRAQLRERFDADADDGSAEQGAVRGDLRFFTGGGAWAVLGALVLSVAAFPALLAWPVLGGGALQPLPATVARLWADAAYGLRSTGLDGAMPADPYAGVIAAIGSLSPADPSRAMVLLWILALPLAVLGGWFAATRLTERPLLRILAGAAWALAPTFLAALVDGRPTGVLVHLLLPWALFAGSVAHRSWAAAGAASIVVAAVVACSPSLAPAVIVIWLGMIVLTAVVRSGRGLSRVLWLVVPTVFVALPLVWHQLRVGNPWGLLADPGLTWAGPQAASSVHGRALLAAGFPTADPGGWGALLHEWGRGTATWWVPLLVAPIAVLALLAPFTARWAAGIVLLSVSALGLGTAFAAAAIAVASSADIAVAIWPGAGLSLAWIGALGAAVVFLDAGLAARVRLLRTGLAVLVMAALAVVAFPALTSATRGTTLLTNGPASTLPAYVAAEGRQDAQIGTFTIAPLDSGAAASDVVWGGSETLAGHSTIQASTPTATRADREVAALTADLVTSTSPDVVARLAARGIGFVVLAPTPGDESDQARALSMQAKTALDQRDGLEQVGTTEKGTLWRVGHAVADRAAATDDQRGTAVLIAVLQLGVLLVALLLAIPTRASRRAARHAPRVVGPRGQEAR
ncbi:glycosyltransferase [Microbacterium rhizosphaerae]|uniref:Glycosyl transferase n=1 Tax=Microbacterium rhizosphaerae TaxID=1678237 RepID=A0ABZ0ST52_9MICO|nr:glycosyl transferase [Microbacterium rhizosphaerae]WPR90842.1 glycosyl transferase [Microbacterium rhizosphaerae]